MTSVRNKTVMRNIFFSLSLSLLRLSKRNNGASRSKHAMRLVYGSTRGPAITPPHRKGAHPYHVVAGTHERKPVAWGLQESNGRTS